MLEVFDGFECIDTDGLFPSPARQAAAEKQKIAARALKTKTRVQARRASSQAVLAELLPEKFSEGESWHVISGGDIDSLSYLEHVLQHDSLDYVLMSTWCMASADVCMIEQWLRDGRIGRLDAYVGEIFPAQYTDVHADLCRVTRAYAGRVAVFRNHCKIFAGCNAAQAYVIESSANVNTNPRTEQTTLTVDRTLFDFYKDFFDGIKSFTRDFDEWTPWQGL
jgi:hypothetical protein